MPEPTPIAVDPAYTLKDNQFWYGKCRFADQIHDKATIRLRIAGLGVRVLRHAAYGIDGRVTKSFTLPSLRDRRWWEEHRGEDVKIELLPIDDEIVPPTQERRTEPQPPIPTEQVATIEAPNARLDIRPTIDPDAPTLCVGLDLAWFGGSKGDPDSHYDCLGWVYLDPAKTQLGALESGLHRIYLSARDKSASVLHEGFKVLMSKFSGAKRVVLAIDAPIQAQPRGLPARSSLPKEGSVQRRACDTLLDLERKRLEKAVGRKSGWHPNIQPGAPLAPRIEALLGRLKADRFELWTKDNGRAERLVIECFPAEAIWAMKHLNKYPAGMNVACAKAYKGLKGKPLSKHEVESLVHNVLDAFADSSGDSSLWKVLIERALAWMLADNEWQLKSGTYRGGKLLDDVVDTLICLATSLSYVHGGAHVWQKPSKPGDGHIIGPGLMVVKPW